jgi:hypothetical protein
MTHKQPDARAIHQGDRRMSDPTGDIEAPDDDLADDLEASAGDDAEDSGPDEFFIDILTVGYASWTNIAEIEFNINNENDKRIETESC